MATVYRYSDISSVILRDIFVDANILISIYYPMPIKSPFPGFCSRDLKTFFNSHTNLVTDVIVLSEFYNRWIKEKYKSYCSVNNLNNYPFKNYRLQLDYINNINEICSLIQTISQKIKVLNPNYSESDFIAGITPVNCANIDFNDLHIVSVCSKNNFCLWTNDIDFKGQNIDIFTESPKY